MNNNNDIQETINQILESLKKAGMTESSIKSVYCGVYNTFLRYLSENKITDVSEEICLQYIESKNQIRLPSLLTVTGNRSLNRRIRPLVVLLRYQQTGILDLSTRGKKIPFSCPATFSPAFEAFVKETEQYTLADVTKSTIIKSVQTFILSVYEDGLTEWDMMDMSYIDSFLSKYKNNRIKYRGTLLYGLKKFLHFLFDNGFCEIDYVEDILSLRIPRNGHIPHTWTQDELKNGRPESGYTNVFLAHHFPYGPIGSTSSLNDALRKYLIKAEIEIKPGEAHGIHTLRSTLAQNMLFCGTELPVISQTLAHQDERTTVGNYLRIDTEHLRDCSLELEWEDEADEEL